MFVKHTSGISSVFQARVRGEDQIVENSQPYFCHPYIPSGHDVAFGVIFGAMGILDQISGLHQFLL